MPDDDDGWQTVVSAPRDEDVPDADWEKVAEEVGDSVEQADQPDNDEDYFQSFDGRWRQEFEGLAYLGHLEAEVKIPYHTFQVRTLKTGEKIRVVELIKPLEDSVGYARAYRAAVVAAALVLVDGQPLLVGSRKIDAISQKYQYVIENWYDFVIDVLFEKVDELEGQVLEVLKELGVYQPRRDVAQAAAAVATGTVSQ